WDSTTNAGFSSAPKEMLYIRQDESPDRPTAAAQMADESSLWHEINRLIKIRRSHKALMSKGDIEFIYAEKNAYPLAYIRSAEDERILVIINPADREVTFNCSYAPKGKLYSLGGDINTAEGTITVPPCFAGYYVI
ncbi:MAG: alpha-glucosidase C-terminal domain-containing protein, partial [Oscillospiraceae bacterium]